MRFMPLFSRQGKLRLQKWYLATADKDKKKMVRELMQVVLARKPKMCSFLEWRDLKVVYKRYASLYFCCAIEGQDNELITLELIHRYVELLDKYFGSVSGDTALGDTSGSPRTPQGHQKHLRVIRNISGTSWGHQKHPRLIRATPRFTRSTPRVTRDTIRATLGHQENPKGHQEHLKDIPGSPRAA
ncbi:PREDICTED: AP-1 complex subunit sigma-1A [Corvus brachyrhynchos]|nr:PREDICTED: AP-1 complex subunit sigma-1A [Corvus brachyrhynchos]